MADLAAGDVTYTILKQRRLSDSRVMNLVRIAFGNGSLTFPAGGLPLTKGKLGCPNVIESLHVVDQGASTYKYQYDQSEEKLIALSSYHAHNISLINAAVADSANARVNAGANLLGANTGANLTITGDGANGGIVGTSALVDGVGGAPAAQTLEVEVIGW